MYVGFVRTGRVIVSHMYRVSLTSYAQDALAALPGWAVEVQAAGARCSLAGAAAVQRPEPERAAHVATARQQAAAQVCGLCTRAAQLLGGPGRQLGSTAAHNGAVDGVRFTQAAHEHAAGCTRCACQVV
jgi:hypothetical protein